MKLEKVKEILELNIKEAGKQMPPDVKTALEISLQAVDRELSWRQRYPHQSHFPFPGETDDNGSK